jgi:hypothetical protein
MEKKKQNHTVSMQLSDWQGYSSSAAFRSESLL